MDYPCSESGHRQGAGINGLAFFAAQPHVALRWHVLIALNCVEELGDSCVFLMNAIFCLTALLLPVNRAYRLMRRVFLVAPYFIHHLLSVPLLAATTGGVPTLLARQVPLRPLFVLYFALRGARWWEVVALSVVVFWSTVATTGLLLEAGVPLYYRPVRVLVHIVLASLAATAWAALWDGLLPIALLQRRLGRRGRAMVAATASASGSPSSSPAVQHAAPGAAALPAGEGPVGAEATEGPAGAAGAEGLTALALAPATAAAMDTGGGKRRHDGFAGIASWGRRAAADEAKVVEGGGVRKRRRGRIAALASEAADLQPSDDAADSSLCLTASKDGDSFASCAAALCRGGCNDGSGGVDGGSSSSGSVCRPAVVAAERLPLWLLSLLRTPGAFGGSGSAPPALEAAAAPLSAAAAAAALCTARAWPQQLCTARAWPQQLRRRSEEWRRLDFGAAEEQQERPWRRRAWVRGGALQAGATRRRFASQLQREVLRVRIVGADPDQLPPDWREVVLGHFDGRRCGGALDGPAATSYLASGVAVRRGSIFLTVSLVQLPSHHDGGERPGGVGLRPTRRSEGAEAEAGAATGAAARTGGELSDAPVSEAAAAGSGTPAPGGMAGGAAAAAAAAAAAVPSDGGAEERAGTGQGESVGRAAGAQRPAPWTLSPPQEQPTRQRLRASLARRASAGPDERHGGGANSLEHAAGAVAGGAAVTAPSTVGGTGGIQFYGRGPLSPRVQPADGAGVAGGLHGVFGMAPSPSGYAPGARRRIAGVWRAERYGGALPSTNSPASTPGNSNTPLHLLGPAAAGSLWSAGSPPPAGPACPAAGSTASVSLSTSPAPGAMGQWPGGLQHLHLQPMRYTPMLSPGQQASICLGLGPFAPLAAPIPATGGGGGGGSSRSFSTEPLYAPTHAPQLAQYRAVGVRSSLNRGSSLTHGSVRTGSGGAGSMASAGASMQVAQLLDAMQLRSREASTSATALAAATSREARHGCALSVLSAVCQLDGGVPLHLRQVLATESWEAGGGEGEVPSSSWEVDGVYERPQSPPLLEPAQQVQAGGAAVGATALPGRAAAADTARSAAAARGQVAGGPAQAGYPAAGSGSPGGVYPGLAPQPQSMAMWPSHTAGLAVTANPASLPVHDVAVKPVLICRAPLVCAAAAGHLAASIPATAAADAAAAAAVDAAAAHADSGPDVVVGGGAAAAAVAGAAGVGGPTSELQLSLMCAPSTVSELSVMLRYCGPASVFGEQTYLPVQLQLDSSSPAVAAAIRLQAAASDRDRRGGDTQAARDVAEAATHPLPAHATVRTALAGLACPGVLYVELWHGPQLCACLPVLLLPESAAGWAHEVCSLWQQQAEEGEAAAAVATTQGGGGGRAGAAAEPAAAHQVVEDLGGWLTYAAHKHYIAERAAAAAAAAAAATASPTYQSLGMFRALQYHPQGYGGGAAGSTLSTATATFSPPQFMDDWFSGWVGDMMQADAAGSGGALSPMPYAAAAVPAAVQPAPPRPQTPPPRPPSAAAAAAGGGSYVQYSAAYDGGGGAAAAAAAAAACSRELFHDMMLQEGYNWLADCVEAGCCGLAAALMESLLAVGCSAAEVLRTCRSADGLPLIHAATLSGNPDMMNLVWGWGRATDMDLLGWASPPPPLAPTSAPCALAPDAAAAAAAVASAASAAAPTLAGAVGGSQSGRWLVGGVEAAWFAVRRSLAQRAVSAYRAALRALVRMSPRRAVGRSVARFAGAVCAAAAAAAAAIRFRSFYSRGGNAVAAAQAAAAASTDVRLARQGSRGADDDSAPPPPPPGVGSSAAGGSGSSLWWRRRRAAAQRVALAVLQGADVAVMGLHSAVLRANPLHVDGGAEERSFLSHFQQRHGWVFSAWCWSMIPLYALIGGRCLLERQWAQLALTPLWMWMYVVCAAADMAGATAAYRRRTEALAAAMHLSHSLSKALHIAGLPSYPVPAGRLYWLDVLACATLSALCEPVRICVACPLRLINFVVSTALYRVTGTAPTYLEAMLLSASCHCFGLLMQHAVESHYRRSFAALQQGGQAGGGAAGAAPAMSLSDKSRGGGGGGMSAPVQAAEQLTGHGHSSGPPSPPGAASPPPSLFDSSSSSPEAVIYALASAEDSLPLGQPSPAAGAAAPATAAAASAAAAAAAAAAEATAVMATAEPPPPLRRSSIGWGGFSQPLERDGARVRDRGLPSNTGGVSTCGSRGFDRQLRELDAPVVHSREDFLLPDGVWESPDGIAGDGGAWSSSGWPSADGASVAVPPPAAVTTVPTVLPPPPLRPRALESLPALPATPLAHEPPLQLPPPQEEEQQQEVASGYADPWEDGEGARRSPQLALRDCDMVAWEVRGGRRDGGGSRGTSPPSPLPPPQQPDAVAAAPVATAVARIETGALSTGAVMPAPAQAAATPCARGGSDGTNNGSSCRNDRRGHRCCGGGGDGGTQPSRRGGESSGASDSGSARASNSHSNSSGGVGAGSSSSSRPSGGSSTRPSGGGISSRGSGGSLRQLVTRAKSWVAGTLRRRLSSSRGVASGGSKGARSS